MSEMGSLLLKQQKELSDNQLEIFHLRQALLESQAEVARLKKPWRPISEAPKDETSVDLLLKYKHPKTGEARYYRLTDCWYCPDSNNWLRNGHFDEVDIISDPDNKITHYTPIPDFKGEI